MKTIRLITQIAALLLVVPALHAQIVGPGYSGINRITLPGNSDTVLSVPFARPEAAGGLALSFTGNVVTFQGTPGWTANQFVAGGSVTDTFYLLIGSGPKEGAAYTITANGANAVTVDLDGDTLTGLAATHKLSIIPYWTLATLFPGGAGVHVSPSPGDRRTEILFPNFSATGINASAGRIFYLWSGSWREVGQGAAIRDNEIVYPETYFTVRHNIATPTEFVGSGQVVPGKLTTWFGVNAAGKRDNYVGLQRPIATTLAESGLVSSGAFSASPTPGNRTDELLVFDNTVARQNKAASAIYYYWSGAWRKVGAGTTSFDNTPVFTPGAGFIIRKNNASTAPVWTNSANY
jgi:uncharacterized protein (TIGR02597 family)